MALSRELAARLQAFHKAVDFARRGGVITDLDGTAVEEHEGRVRVAVEVEQGLKSLADLGRPVVVNTLRFPLNVVRTFGRAWSAITAQPIPLVSLNGSVFGLLDPTGPEGTTFEELEATPLSEPCRDTAAIAATAAITTSTVSTRQKVSLRRNRRRSTIWSASSGRESSDMVSLLFGSNEAGHYRAGRL